MLDNEAKDIPKISQAQEIEFVYDLEQSVHEKKFQRVRQILQMKEESLLKGIDQSKLNMQRKLIEYEAKKGIKVDEETKSRLQSTVIAKERGLALVKSQRAFLRPSTDEDILYRQKVYDQLPALLKASAHPDIPFRFHGTPIYGAKDIITSRNLSSTADRLGIDTSYDTTDQLSVTTVDTLRTTVESYTSLNELEYQIPAGCIFVLLPKSAAESVAGASLLMNSVNLNESPSQLFAVLVSKEMSQEVKTWMAGSNLPAEKVYDFLEFPTIMKELASSINSRKLTPHDIVSYLP
ncbi:hypothetical protein BH09PAT1_BH09PAT1_2410 [soil metagenome]